MTKSCVECRQEKDEAEFPRSKVRADGSVLTRPRCKECYALSMVAWRANNPEKVTESNRSYYERNREKERERNREKGRRRDWGPKNAARRAREAARWTTKEVVAVHGTACHLCGKEINADLRYPDPASFSRDHVVPLSRGGSNGIENVKPAHLRCNVAKRDGRKIRKAVR